LKTAGLFLDFTHFFVPLLGAPQRNGLDAAHFTVTNIS
jgi:hypothetical protein